MYIWEIELIFVIDFKLIFIYISIQQSKFSFSNFSTSDHYSIILRPQQHFQIKKKKTRFTPNKLWTIKCCYFLWKSDLIFRHFSYVRYFTRAGVTAPISMDYCSIKRQTATMNVKLQKKNTYIRNKMTSKTLYV